MGSGCLAPKPIMGDLVIQLINQLHTTNPTNTHEQKYIEQQLNYNLSKQKIFKKAPLKKLIDYLSSHRHKICDSMAYNLKVAIQKGRDDNWVIALVIMERIILMGKSNYTAPGHSEIVLRSNANIRTQNTEESRYILKSLKTEADKQNNNQSKMVESGKNCNDSILKQLLSSRFEALIYNTVYTILNQEELYKQCLRIFADYLKLDNGKLNSDQKLLELLEILLNNLKVQYQTIITLQIYYRLIYRLKDKTILSISAVLKTITKIWLDKQTIARTSKKMIKIEKAEEQSNYLELIICQFFSSSLNGLQYNKIISILLQIYDEYNFQLPEEYENMYIHVLNSNDLGQNFLKALFLQFLRYGILGSSKKGELKQNIFNELIFLNNQKQLKNHSKYLTRMKLFQLIKRWLIYKNYIQLSQIIKYHSSMFIYCFILSFGQENAFISSSFIEIVKKINAEEQVILLETIYEEYQKEETYSKIRVILLSLSKNINDLIKSVSVQQHSSLRFIIDIQFLTATEALDFYSSLIKLYEKYDKDSKVLYMQQICELLASTIGFFNNQEFDQYKSELIKKILSFLRGLTEVESIIIAFYQKIDKIIQRKFSRGEEHGYYQELKEGILAIFKKEKISNYEQEDFSIQKENYANEKASGRQVKNMNQFYNCKTYFKELISMEGRSKIDMKQTGNFEKAGSMIQESELKDQEQSFKDIMEMINL